jgi:dTDP-4-dehydrorhamnose reductase
MKILILGARGNLGAQLCAVFSKPSNVEVIGWDKEDVDITDGANLAEKIISLKPNFIINAAAYNAVDNCETDENEFALAKKINGEAVGFILAAAEKINAVLIHYSTDYVFDGLSSEALAKGGNNPRGYDEQAKPNPINKYGFSKLLGERQLTNQRKPRHYLIRTSKLFGPRGESAAAKPSFFDLMLGTAAEKNKTKVVDEEKSCFTYTPDLAEATKKLLAEKKPFGIYHLANSNPATWYEAAVELFKIAGIDKKIIPISGSEFPRPAKRPACSILLNTKLPPLRSYQSALAEYIKKVAR